MTLITFDYNFFLSARLTPQAPLRQGTMAISVFWQPALCHSNISWINDILKFHMSQTKHWTIPPFPKPGFTPVFTYHLFHLPHTPIHIVSQNLSIIFHFFFLTPYIYLGVSSEKQDLSSEPQILHLRDGLWKEHRHWNQTEVGSSYFCLLIARCFWTIVSEL